ncbi:MAG: M28 family peptidase [Clostridiales bacterium]|nr:M28 family peptidase [Clostridiales bacterium]
MQIKRNIVHILFFAVILAAGIFLGFFTMRTPEPYEGGDETAFSVDRVRETIGEIAKEPHPVDTEAHERVCDYVCSRLAELGLEPDNGYSGSEESYVVTTYGYKNIFARLDGASDNAVLLVAHYDSARSSFGAADDGYGIATILETLRAIKAQKVPLLNDIMVLFTDGEELWMEGAKSELRHNLQRYKNVLLVINVEANGMKGPPLMFETGDKNAAVVGYYAKHAKNPVAYSFTTAYYSFMPDNTDFSIFRNYGFNGLNFAVLDGFEYHHTPGDNPDNIDLRSLQHYGDQVFSIVKSFVSDPSVSPEHFTSDTNRLFFTVFPGVLVSYSEAVSNILAVAAAALFIALAVIGCVSRRIKPGKTLVYTALLLVSVMFISLASEGVIWLLSALSSRRFKLVNMLSIPHADLIYWLVNIAAAVLLGVICRRLVKRSPGPELLFSGIFLSLLLSVLLILFLPGSAYIAVLPSLLASLYAAAHFIKYKAPRIIILAFASFLGMIIYVPIVTLVFQAMSIGLTGAGVFLCLLPFTTLLPMFFTGLYAGSNRLTMYVNNGIKRYSC